MIRTLNDTFKCMNTLAPRYLSSMFTVTSAVHSHNTRNCDKLQIPKCRISLSQQAFNYRAVSSWNSLPNNIRELKSLKHFKFTLKSHLLTNWKQRLPWAYVHEHYIFLDLYIYYSLWLLDGRLLEYIHYSLLHHIAFTISL